MEQNTQIDEQTKAQVSELVKTAKGLLFGDNFDNMKKVFQTAGIEGFAEAMATVVTGTLQRLQQDNGQLSPEVLAYTAMAIIAMLSSDLEKGGVLKGLGSEHVQAAISAVIQKMSSQEGGLEEMPQQQEGLQQQAPVEPMQQPGVV